MDKVVHFPQAEADHAFYFLPNHHHDHLAHLALLADRAVEVLLLDILGCPPVLPQPAHQELLAPLVEVLVLLAVGRH